MSKRILVVDDSETERYTIGETLKKAGHFVFFAEDGEKGVEQAALLKPDLIVMDVVMPGMSGFQACRQITQNGATSHIPVIICTTKDQESDKAWGARQGAKFYVVKPIDPDELLARVRELLP